MKLPGYILAFYLILLAAVPCCAFDNCSDETTTGQATGHEDKDCGNCSPFFNCEGCATATIAYEPPSLEISPVTTLSVYTIYIQPALPTADYDFWQPPKLS